MGYGHVIRTFALAQCCLRIQCIFLRVQIQKLTEQGDIKVIQLPEFNDLNQEAEFISEEYFTGNEIVVIDGYQFNTDYQDTMRLKGGKLLAIDDIASYFFSCDAIINTSEGISKNEYSTAFYTLLYLGSKYCLLRPPFLIAAEKESVSPQLRREVFINMGGSDPGNYTVQVIKELVLNKCNLPGNIVVGNNYPFKN
jgi:spore coat polysaccharide biosynthesis predicted glycosyltransferase SpsG